jgi:hypothetical protein
MRSETVAASAPLTLSLAGEPPFAGADKANMLTIGRGQGAEALAALHASGIGSGGGGIDVDAAARMRRAVVKFNINAKQVRPAVKDGLQLVG